MKTAGITLRADESTKAGALCIAALVALAISGCAGPGSRGGRLNATEKMMWSTYPVATGKGMATGFVIARRGANTPVFFTSMHVLETVGRRPFVVGARVPDAGGGAHAVLVQFQPPRGSEPFYVRHPLYDLAAFVVNVPPDLARVVSMLSCLDERSLATGRDVFRTGAEVSFLGFPEVLPGTTGAFPVLRTGRIASYRRYGRLARPVCRGCRRVSGG